MTLLSPRTGPHALGLAALIFVAALPGLAAQEAQRVAPSSDEVTLAYKYRTGQVQKFRAVSKSDVTVTPEGGGAGFAIPPIAVNTQYVYTEKVAGEKDGTGTLSLAMSGLLMTTSVMGMDTVIKMVNGKTTATINGQPAAGMGPGMGMLQNLFSSKPVMLKRDVRGNAAAALTGANPGQLFGMAAMTGVSLPETPVKVGDTWESTRRTAPSLPGPLAAAGSAPDVDMKFTHSLKALEVKNGKQFAIIESTGSPAPPMAAGAESTVDAANQSIATTSRFDVARGALVSSRSSIEFSMKIASPTLPGGPASGGAPPAAGPMGGQSLRIDGTVELTLTEVPAAHARPATRAPARRRPARRK